MINIFRTTLFVTVVSLVPLVSHGFSPDKVTAIQLTETTALYMIDYRLGYEKYAMQTPISARQDANESIKDSVVSYSLTSDGESYTTDSDVQSIVLSNAEVVDGNYQIKKGRFERFTLIVLVKSAEGSLPELMAVTDLPFVLIDGEQSWQNGLSTGELETFQTTLPDRTPAI